MKNLLLGCLAIVCTLLLVQPAAFAQDAAQDEAVSTAPDRSATGGAQTLEDILARQRGEALDDSFRRDATGDPNSAKSIAQQLGTLGGQSDPELWRALRYNSADIRVSAGGAEATTLVQDGGMTWLNFREGPLRQYGGWLLFRDVLALGDFLSLARSHRVGRSDNRADRGAVPVR